LEFNESISKQSIGYACGILRTIKIEHLSQDGDQESDKLTMDSDVYVFFDERYEHDKSFSNLIVSAVLVSQSTYNAHAPRAKFQRKTNRLAEVHDFLVKLGGYAHLGIARIRREDFDSNEIDRYADVEMKRRDHLWSLIVSFTVCDLIAKILASGESVQIIDIYHDPKSLRLDHVRAWRDSITRRMAQRGREVIQRKGLSHIVPFSIRNLTEVDKAQSKNSPDMFQRGVWIADQLARHQSISTFEQFSRITIQNFSAYIEEILRGS
jgi:hypothetical protein